MRIIWIGESNLKKKLIWIISIIAAILVLFIIALIVKNATGESDDKNTYEVYKAKHESPLTMQGKASPDSVKSYLNNSSVGDYLYPTVSDGQSVVKGQQLISYDTSGNSRQQLVDKVNQAQEAKNQAPNDTKAQSELTKANDALNQFDKQVNDSMYASFPGKIDIIQSNEPNDGETIMQLISNEPQIKTTVSEFDINKLEKGKQVDFTINNNGEKGTGQIKKISELPTSYEDSLQGQGNAGGASGMQGAGDASDDGQAGGGGQASNPVVNDVGGKGNSNDASKYNVISGNLSKPVRAGFSLDVSVKSNDIKLPPSVLTKDNYVFVVNKNNKIEKRKIEIKESDGEKYVKSGLKEGERLVKHPKSSLKDGDKIEVKK